MVELPVVSPGATERADAARNRERILGAAERLFSERGVGCTSMDAIAAAAGVGKATLFRRFGDRAALALAVLDRDEREFQEAILRGPPPLGPGAPPQARLATFGAAMLERLETHGELLLEGELRHPEGIAGSPPFAVYWVHVRTLLLQARPEADYDYLTELLLGPLSAQTFRRQRQVRHMDLDRMKAGYGDLVARLLA